jgi:hypothetical protein
MSTKAKYVLTVFNTKKEQVIQESLQENTVDDIEVAVNLAKDDAYYFSNNIPHVNFQPSLSSDSADGIVSRGSFNDRSTDEDFSFTIALLFESNLT